MIAACSQQRKIEEGRDPCSGQPKDRYFCPIFESASYIVPFLSQALLTTVIGRKIRIRSDAEAVYL